MNKYFYCMLIACIAALCLGMLTTDVVHAQGGGPGDELTGAFDDVLEFIRGIAESVIQFFLFVGGLVFAVSLVWSAARGSLGQAIGNQMQVSNSIVTAAMAIMAFIFLVASVPIGQRFASTLVDRFTNADAIQPIVVSELGGSGGGIDAASPEDILQSDAIQGVIIDIAVSIIRLMIGIGIIAFFVAITRGAFDTQLGTLLGGGPMAAAGISRAIGSIVALMFLVIAYPLSQTFIETLVPRLLSGYTIPLP